MGGTLRIRAQAVIEGPIGDGRATEATREWSRRVSQELGEEGVRQLRAFPMDKSGRSHGNFRRTLAVMRKSPAEVRIPGVQERGIVWASWLEGTSERNRSTGFKGYRLFRKARKALDEKAPEIGQKALDELLPEIGGA